MHQTTWDLNKTQSILTIITKISWTQQKKITYDTKSNKILSSKIWHEKKKNNEHIPIPRWIKMLEIPDDDFKATITNVPTSNYKFSWKSILKTLQRYGSYKKETPKLFEKLKFNRKEVLLDLIIVDDRVSELEDRSIYKIWTERK